MIKKFITSILLAILILIGLIQTAQASPIVILNGKVLSFNPPPLVENGRILVPIRPIFEALGANVSWDNDSKTVTAIKGTNLIKLQIGSPIATKNGLTVNLDTQTKIINGTTFVPVRFVSESMDCNVNWVEELQSVIITDQNVDSTEVYSDLKKNIEGRILTSFSMMPTIMNNDRVLIDKSIYSTQEPQRGDIIVFWPPKEINSTEAYLQRIVAIPGDTVAIKNGKLYINDQVYTEPYISEPMAYEFEPIKVPPDSYFVLGDNRNISFDSHLWANCFVPKSNIIGKALFIYYPIEHLKSL